MLSLIITKRTDSRLLHLMDRHYSQPKGFVGRSICYAILYNDIYYGHTIAGSATRFLPGRNEFLNITINDLNSVANNIFFHIEKVNGCYPIRNFTPYIINEWCRKAIVDWEYKYGDKLTGFETLVELPRTGECYRRAGWTEVGVTKGIRASGWRGRGQIAGRGKECGI